MSKLLQEKSKDTTYRLLVISWTPYLVQKGGGTEIDKDIEKSLIIRGVPK